MIKIYHFDSGCISFLKKVTFVVWHLDLILTFGLFCLLLLKLKRIVTVLPASCPGCPLTTQASTIRHSCYRIWIQSNKWQQHPVSQASVRSGLQRPEFQCPVVRCKASVFLLSQFYAFSSCLFSVPCSPVFHMIVCATQWLFNILFSFPPEIGQGWFLLLTTENSEHFIHFSFTSSNESSWTNVE